MLIWLLFICCSIRWFAPTNCGLDSAGGGSGGGGGGGSSGWRTVAGLFTGLSFSRLSGVWPKRRIDWIFRSNYLYINAFKYLVVSMAYSVIRDLSIHGIDWTVGDITFLTRDRIDFLNNSQSKPYSDLTDKKWHTLLLPQQQQQHRDQRRSAEEKASNTNAITSSNSNG